MSETVIVDYGMANLRSVQKAFERVGHAAVITGDPTRVGTAGKVVAGDASAADVAARPATAAPKPEAPAPKPAASSAAGTGFAVQLSAPSVEAEANALRDRARAQGLNSFVQPVETDSGRRYRVRVGPVPSVAEFDRLVQELKGIGVNDARLALD